MKGCGCVVGMVIVGICVWFVSLKAGADKISAMLVRTKQTAIAWVSSKGSAEGIPGMVSRARQAVIEVDALDAQGNLLGTGTAFFIRNDGTAVTNFHVIEGASRLVGLSNTGAEYRFERVISHPAGVDLAILKFSGVDVPYLTLEPSLSAREGQRILVIGNPKGLQGTVSDGLISAFREDRSVIQISAPLSPGSSGSPVLNEDGQVIGVAFLQLVNGQNLNFAIASKEVEKAERVAALPGTIPDPNAEATYRLGYQYEKGQGVTRDYGRARDLYQQAADGGNVDAMNRLGGLYYYGWCIGKNYSLADSWWRKAADGYRKAAEVGDPHAMGQLGELYACGNGVRRDYVQALNWFQKAAKLGDGDAMKYLGDAYYGGRSVSDDGIFVAKDRTQSLRWFQMAADKGNTTAMISLGSQYCYGMGVAQDYAQALFWFRKAAEAGDTFAMTDMGIMYEDGRGVRQDYARGHSWWQKAADSGDTEAMRHLAMLYRLGQNGVAQDYAQALFWYRKAADACDTEAMCALGYLYKYGEGVPQDYTQALFWYQKAVDAGWEPLIGFGEPDVIAELKQLLGSK